MSKKKALFEIACKAKKCGEVVSGPDKKSVEETFARHVAKSGHKQ